MPQYSGNLIYQDSPGVKDLAQNYLRTDASSNFGTRKLAWYTVRLEQDYGLAANWRDSNSLYYQIVRAIQQGSANIGGADAPTETGTIKGGGGGGAELFYVGEPQNSANSLANLESRWYGFKPTYSTENYDVLSASGTGTVATLTFVPQSTPPFNVGDPLYVSGIGSGYNTDYPNSNSSVISCTTTQVTYHSSATASLSDGGDPIGYVQADLGYDCFMFAIVDDADPLLPEGNGVFGDTDFSGVAGDASCYCGSGRYSACITPFNFGQAVYQVLYANELGNNFSIWRLKATFGLTF